jgi:multidrug efflux pump subunit AcrB
VTERNASPRLGLSGWLAARFQAHPLTPVLALAALLLGLIAVLLTPREEEPQIDVTMANVFVALPGSPAEEIERLLSVPLQQAMSEVEGVKHVYALSTPGLATVTVEFEVGVPRQAALVRLHNQMFNRGDLLPSGLGALPPLVKPLGIDDVPVMALTLWSNRPEIGAVELGEVGRALASELKRVRGTRDITPIGAPPRHVLVELDAQRLAAYGLTAEELAGALIAANQVQQAGERLDADGSLRPLTAGQFLASAEDVAGLVIGLRDGQPLRLADVARIEANGDAPSAYAWHLAGVAHTADGPRPEGAAPAVTLAIAKQPGTNATDVTRALIDRVDLLKGSLIPDGVELSITRDYGATAHDKAMTLISKLVFATMAVILLVLFTLGWREAIVVGTAVVLTLAITLFASWAMGFTLNRVSLFALIFAIGILVDDAIVVVENIHRHMQRGGLPLREALPRAVDEIGGPTILATFTVIAALLPMAFVTGLMGPYMRPIPINASVGMLLSLIIALTVTPWLALRLLGRHHAAHGHAANGEKKLARRLHTLFERIMRPFLDARRGARRQALLLGGIVAAVALSLLLVVTQAVVLKMLPFDNKSEFQIVVDLPEGSPVERSNALLQELAVALAAVPEVESVQGYAGTTAPITFNGLVRQYGLRQSQHLGDLQVNLVDKSQRTRKSHEIALAVRPMLTDIANRHRAALKVVEVPPGPPVLAPLVAEISAGSREEAAALARRLQGMAEGIEGLVDLDTTLEAPAVREQWVLDRAAAARLGVDQASLTRALALAVDGLDASFLRDGRAKQAVPLRLRLSQLDRAQREALLALPLRTHSGGMVALGAVVRVEERAWEPMLMQKDLLPVVYLTGDEAGALDSPLYGLFALAGELRDAAPEVGQHFFTAPDDAFSPAVKWDGEWQVTWQTFRDMGLAYAGGMVLIYLLIVAQFRSYVVPLVIMAPIPLTVIGVMPGHALLGAQFTATSMIGMIALAGIIVRNSILLVDFIAEARRAGSTLDDAVIDACAARSQPIALTALAAMLGALFILDDPIFNGLAISLVFGIAVSTVLTLVVIPLLYAGWLRRSERPFIAS